MKQTYQLISIGTVHAKQGQFYLQISHPYLDALKGLDGFNLLNIIWWADQSDSPQSRKQTVCKKPYQKSPDVLGVFATRSPVRPNPIAITPVQALNIDYAKGTISTPYMDADDGTPILDIKPYHPCTDRAKNITVPDWCAHWPQWMEESANFDWEKEFTF